MSADLFAEFEDFSQPKLPATGQAKPAASQTPQASTFVSDPLSTSTAPPATSSVQQPSHQTQPWPFLKQNPSIDPWGDFAGADSSEVTSQETIDDDEDGWGDFEVAENASNTPAQPVSSAVSKPKATSTLRPSPLVAAVQRTRIVRASTIELMTNSLLDIPGVNDLPVAIRSPAWMQNSLEQERQRVPQSMPQKPTNTDPNVLFDADDFDGGDENREDDDFGDFETSAIAPPTQAQADLVTSDLYPPPATGKKTPSQLLSALNLSRSSSPYPQAPKSPSFHERNPFPGLGLTTPTEPKTFHDDDPRTSPITAWPVVKEKGSAGSNGLGDWGNFDDVPANPSPSKETKTADDNWDWDAFDTKKPGSHPPKKSTVSGAERSANKADSSWTWDSVDITSCVPTQSNEDKSSPTNVPPPSVLLSIFPQLLCEANASLFKTIGGQPFSVKNRILSDPKTVEFLRGYLLLATVAARIIAGRKLRWHRDKFLSQGMSISASGSKGMKLAGIDKSQAAREDREAADILDSWKENIGRLRSLLAAANSAIKNTTEQLKIPDLRENMQVQTAKTVPTAPKPCFICGLKRDERVSRIDFEVEDSFGEFWVEHWGHTTCKRFWLQHESALRQR